MRPEPVEKPKNALKKKKQKQSPTEPKHRGPRTSISQCRTALLRLHRRIAEQELEEYNAVKSVVGDAAGSSDESHTKPIGLTELARQHLCFQMRRIEQQLFEQCRKLMCTSNMSPKMLTASMFLCWDKDLARKACKRADEYCQQLEALDKEYDANYVKKPRRFGGVSTKVKNIEKSTPIAMDWCGTK